MASAPKDKPRSSCIAGTSQVDAFELAVETPSPAAPQRHQQSPPTAEAAPPPANETSTAAPVPAVDLLHAEQTASLGALVVVEATDNCVCVAVSRFPQQSPIVLSALDQRS